MSAVLVDSNVLLDRMTDDPHWFAWSSRAIEAAADRDRLVINPIVYAEVSVGFSSIESVDAALPAHLFDREHLPYEAAFLAGQMLFLDYRKRGGTRYTPLPDFFIGAHAALAGYRLLTRDAPGYRTYFPQLALICPD